MDGLIFVQSHTPNKLQSYVLFLVSMIPEPAFLITLFLFIWFFLIPGEKDGEANYMILYDLENITTDFSCN